jgi:oligoribonuclease NrnB/cAMP/cGMP phosphodiesterase (DHH superfamily)
MTNNTNNYDSINDYQYITNYEDLDAKYNFQTKKLTANKTKINFVITHGYCSDGFMSATIIRNWLEMQKIDMNTVTFHNACYGDDFSVLPNMMKDKYVLICDFSFNTDLFNKMIEATNGNILILDHHKTAEKNLQNISPEYLTFDMMHSGAFLAWVYMYGFLNVPKAVLYVEDNDIWTKKLPFTREFTAFMYMQEFTFEEYNKFFDDKYLINSVFPMGYAILKQNDNLVKKLSKNTCIPFVHINNRLYFVACLTSGGLFHSELGNNVLKEFPNVNFSMIYYNNIESNNTIISYRSMDNKTDTTEIAKVSGGGGHRNASGTNIPFIVSNPPGKIIDQKRAYWLLDNLYTVNIHDKYKVIVLNSANMHVCLSSYLMQERYFGDEAQIKNKLRYENNLPGYQEGLFCMRNKIKSDDLDEFYHAAVIWSYDGYLNKYRTTIKFLSNEGVSKNIDNYNSNEENSQVLIEYKEKKNNIFEFVCSNSVNNLLELCLI